MTFNATRAALFAAAAITLAAPASAAQIILNAASVIGSNGGFNDTFRPQNIVTTQTGPITERFMDGSYWLNAEGRTGSFITLDLGDAYQLGLLQLFNSRNIGDRGTAGFEIYAGNTLVSAAGSASHATGNRLGTDAQRIVAGTLAFDTAGGDPSPIAAQGFNATDNSTAFRYIEFRPLGSINGAYNNLGFGLNELRVFEYEAPVAPVPEPATWAMMIAGFGITGAAMRRRRRTPAYTIA